MLPQPQVDLFHPLTTLEWERCCKVPDNVTDAQAAVLGNNVYVGGWDSSTAHRGPGLLLIYDVNGDSWGTPIPTPTNDFALTTYGSKLVLVGGRYPYTQEEMSETVTNKLWVLDKQKILNSDCLPAMPTAHWGASAISRDSHLVVAGGSDGCSGLMVEVDVVEVYDGTVWARAQSLPRPASKMKSILHEGNWYLNGQIQIYTSLDSLIATTSSSSDAPDKQTSVWKKLTDPPLHDLSAPTMLGNQLVDIRQYHPQGFSRPKSALHVFSPQRDSHTPPQWVHVGDLPVACHSTCMLLLPTRELLVMVLEVESHNYPRHVFRGSVRGEFNAINSIKRFFKRSVARSCFVADLMV